MKYQTEKRVCDICGSDDNEMLWTQSPHSKCIMIKNDDGSFVHNENVMCMDCGLIYKPETMTRESLKKFYNEEYGQLYKNQQQDSISKEAVVETMFNAVYVCDWLRKIGFDLKGKLSLDIGSGDGMFVRALRGEGADAYGLEISEKATKISKKLHGFDVAVGDIMEGVVIPTKFDLISIRNALEHVYSAKEFLLRVKELLNENGELLLEIPSADRPYVSIPVDAFLSAAHIYTYTIDSIGILADKCGMYISQYGYAGHRGCMLILLKKGKINHMGYVEPSFTYTRIKEIYNARNQTFFNISEKIKELFSISYVTSIIRNIKESKHDSNILTFALLSTLIQDSTKRDIIIGILDEFKWSNEQAYDINCCEASFKYFESIILRELGDYKFSQDKLKIALNMYPNILQYNFVKELKLEGILSDTVLSNLLWYNCFKQSEAMK